MKKVHFVESSTCHVEKAITNRVENRNWLVLVSLTRWRTNRKIIYVSNSLTVPHVSRCPSLPYTLRAGESLLGS